MNKLLMALLLALILFFASTPARAEAPLWIRAFNIGLERGCYMAILRERKQGRPLVNADCEAIWEEYSLP